MNSLHSPVYQPLFVIKLNESGISVLVFEFPRSAMMRDGGMCQFEEGDLPS